MEENEIELYESERRTKELFKFIFFVVVGVIGLVGVVVLKDTFLGQLSGILFLVAIALAGIWHLSGGSEYLFKSFFDKKG